jgi:hypothetical protein
MNFEEKIAYEIGVKMATEAYMEKEAFLGALKNMYTGGKFLLGMGKGNAVTRSLGSATGFGLMGAASSEEGWENKVKGFTGGFAGGLAFGAGMSSIGRLGKALNKSWASSAKNLSNPTLLKGQALDAEKAVLKNLQKQVSKAGPKVDPNTKQKLEAIQKSYKENTSAYKSLLKNEGVGVFSRAAGTIGRHRGAAVGIAGGMGGGMAISGAVQGHIDAKQRPLLPMSNNVFNPVGNYRA